MPAALQEQKINRVKPLRETAKLRKPAPRAEPGVSSASPGCFGTPGDTELLSTTKKRIFLSSAHLLLPLFLSPNTTHVRHADGSQVPCATCDAHGALQTNASQPQNAPPQQQRRESCSLAQGAKPTFPNHPHSPTRQEHCNPAKDRGKGESRIDWEKDVGKVLSQRLQTTGNAGLYSLKTKLNFPCLSAWVLLPHPSFPQGVRERKVFCE